MRILVTGGAGFIGSHIVDQYRPSKRRLPSRGAMEKYLHETTVE